MVDNRKVEVKKEENKKIVESRSAIDIFIGELLDNAEKEF